MSSLGKISQTDITGFQFLPTLGTKVKIDLLEMINYLEYINNVFILSLLCSALKVPL